VDTRTKIIDRAEAERIAAAGARPAVVTGYFDPLTAAHAARLAVIAAAGHPLLVVVRTPEEPLLAARARAELVAALAAVNHVVVEEGDPAWLERLDAAEWIHEEDADLRRRRHLIARVQGRQAAG
jgi:bifunctional ADP-heptose synthase (sugar kinase/adenylyltransferase)